MMYWLITLENRFETTVFSQRKAGTGEVAAHMFQQKSTYTGPAYMHTHKTRREMISLFDSTNLECHDYTYAYRMHLIKHIINTTIICITSYHVTSYHVHTPIRLTKARLEFVNSLTNQATISSTNYLSKQSTTTLNQLPNKQTNWLAKNN